jgi:hypothetical protein
MKAALRLQIMMLQADFEAAAEAASAGEFEAALMTLQGAIAKIQQMAAERRDFEEEKPHTQEILDV